MPIQKAPKKIKLDAVEDDEGDTVEGDIDDERDEENENEREPTDDENESLDRRRKRKII